MRNFKKLFKIRKVFVAPSKWLDSDLAVIWRGRGWNCTKERKKKKEKKKSLWCVFVTTDNVLTKQACKKRFFFSWEKSEEKTNLIGVGNWWLYLWAFFQLQQKHILPKNITGRQKILKVYLFESKHFLLNIFNSFFNIQMGYFKLKIKNTLFSLGQEKLKLANQSFFSQKLSLLSFSTINEVIFWN